MNKRIAVALLVCFLLTGCSVDTMADSLANDIAGQVERMYADGQSPAAPAFDGETATPTVSTAELAEQARQAYERLKEENREDPMVRPWEPLAELAQIRDMNGDGIPELIQTVYGFVGGNNGSLHDCYAELHVENCSVLTGLTNRNWTDIANCTITATGKNVSEFYCAATQNYARISGCTFDVQLTPPAGEELSWATSWLSGVEDDFDSSNTVNVREGN